MIYRGKFLLLLVIYWDVICIYFFCLLDIGLSFLCCKLRNIIFVVYLLFIFCLDYFKIVVNMKGDNK